MSDDGSTRGHFLRHMDAINRAVEATRDLNPRMLGLGVVVVDGDFAETYADTAAAVRARAEREHHDDPCVLVLPEDQIRGRTACAECRSRFDEHARRGIPVLVDAEHRHYAAALGRPGIGDE